MPSGESEGPRAPQLAPEGRVCRRCWVEHVAASSDTTLRIAYSRGPFNGQAGKREPLFEARCLHGTNAYTQADGAEKARPVEVPIGSTDNPQEKARYAQMMESMEKYFGWSHLGQGYNAEISPQDELIGRHTYHTVLAYACEGNPELSIKVLGKAKSARQFKKEVTMYMNYAIQAIDYQIKDRESRYDPFAPRNVHKMVGESAGLAEATKISRCASIIHHQIPRKAPLWFWNQSTTGTQLLAEAQGRIAMRSGHNYSMNALIQEVESHQLQLNYRQVQEELHRISQQAL
ncbi:hypothetical protein NA57DRAFT_80621 [Rhizodiscina lignyota]|uniref:Uncharacterized protein n=1 Tax=Rhizodiscina lignyota TaxID=1504668 RepID=A0A9P4I364_9PEZI|nr:hypothetical protein NA57DRAFT_80621 [Rhizodiscina lignyota]